MLCIDIILLLTLEHSKAIPLEKCYKRRIARWVWHEISYLINCRRFDIATSTTVRIFQFTPIILRDLNRDT